MQAVYGAGTDPVPYITLAYGLGATGLFGYAVWTVRQRLKLRALLAAVRRPARSGQERRA